MRSAMRWLLAGLLISAMTVGATPTRAAEGTVAPQGEPETVRVHARDKTTQTVQVKDVSGGKVTFAIQETGYAVVTSCEKVRGTLTIPSEIALQSGEIYPVTEVNSSAFSDCPRLQKVVFPDSIVCIRTEAFFECERLEELVFNDDSQTRLTVTKQGEGRVTSGISPEEEMAEVAMLPENTEQAEDTDTGLVLSGVESAGDDYQLTLRMGETFSIQEHLTHDGESVDASDITIRGSNGVVTVPRRVITTWSTGKADLRISVGQEEVTLHVTVTGNGLTELDDYAFAKCSKLETLLLPSTLRDIGVAPFLYCENLKKIEVEDGNQHFVAVTSNMLCRINKKKYKENRASGMEETEAKRAAADTLVVLANGASGDVAIPEGIRTLAVGAVYGCNQMETITLPSTATELNTTSDPGNFAMCDALRSIAVAEENPSYCTDNGSLYTKDRQTLVKLPEQCGTSVSLPKGVTRIEAYAAAMNAVVTRLTLPRTVRTIGEYAFYDCEKLERLSLKNGLKTIETGAFAQCMLLNRLTIPKSCKQIQESAFSDTGLSKISLPLDGSLKTLETAVFEGTQVEKLVIPASVREIKERALAGMTVLDEVYFMGNRPTLVKSKRGVGGTFAGTDTTLLRVYYRKDTSEWRDESGKVQKIEQATPKTWQLPTTPSANYTRGQKGVTVLVAVNKKQSLTGYQVIYASKKNGTYQQVMTIKTPKKATTVKQRLASGKRGYYKICAYRTIGGTTLMSDWSKPVRVK